MMRGDGRFSQRWSHMHLDFKVKNQAMYVHSYTYINTRM